MSSPFDISVEVATTEGAVDTGALVDLAERVMSGEELPEGTGLAVVFVDDPEIQRLNRVFLGFDEPTDVLSFPDSEEFVQAREAPPYLGDVAISLPTAIRQSRAAAHGLDREVAHLLVHGILHLCGYDHVAGGEEERRMREREEHYLGDLGAAHTH